MPARAAGAAALSAIAQLIASKNNALRPKERCSRHQDRHLRHAGDRRSGGQNGTQNLLAELRSRSSICLRACTEAHSISTRADFTFSCDCARAASSAWSRSACHCLSSALARRQDLVAGGTQLIFINAGLSFRGGNRAPRLLHRTGRPGTPLCRVFSQRAADQHAVGNHQQDEKDHCRHRAEHQTAKLMQNFHEISG